MNLTDKQIRNFSLTIGALLLVAIIFISDFFSSSYKIFLMESLPGAGKTEIEIMKDRPEVRFKKWDGEINFGVSYEKVEGKAEKDAGGKIIWKDENNTKEEVHAYPLEAKAGMENGGFEIEVVLNEKPATNKFDFQIDGYENLNFFYQKLSQSMIDQGFTLEENVVGSYAVYHKNRKDYVKGGVNYGIGKAYHIYRPKAIDAAGKEQWAELHYDGNGILSVTVPQTFLDTAQYPVIVDPTFGDTSCGASDTSGAATATNYLEMTANSPSGVGNTLTNISVCYTPGLNGENFQYGLYSDAGDDPDTRLAYDSVPWQPGNQFVKAFYTNPVAYSYTLSPSTKYWIGVYTSTTGEFAFDITADEDIWYGDTAGLPATAGGTREATIQASAYATYSEPVASDSSNANVNIRGGGSGTPDPIKVRGGGGGSVKFR